MHERFFNTKSLPAKKFNAQVFQITVVMNIWCCYGNHTGGVVVAMMKCELSNYVALLSLYLEEQLAIWR